MSHDIAKPKTAANGVVSVIIESGLTDSQATVPTTDRLFRIKPATVQLGFSVDVADVTGEGDANASYAHNQMTRGAFTVQGYAMSTDQAATDTLGLRFLQSTGNGKVNTAGKTANIRFNWANGKYIYGIALIESIQYSYSRSSVFIGITMSGRFTDTDLGSATYADSHTSTLPT